MEAVVQTARAAIGAGDMIVVGAAGAIFIGASLLQKSLGDVTGEVDALPSSAGAKLRREAQRSKRFLNRNKKKD